MGPWTAYHDYKTTWGVKNSDDEPICDRLDEASARFIAAAPDMKKALEMYIQAEDSDPTFVEQFAWAGEAARAALAKAKGE